MAGPLGFESKLTKLSKSHRDRIDFWRCSTRAIDFWRVKKTASQGRRRRDLRRRKKTSGAENRLGVACLRPRRAYNHTHTRASGRAGTRGNRNGGAPAGPPRGALFCHSSGSGHSGQNPRSPYLDADASPGNENPKESQPVSANPENGGRNMSEDLSLYSNRLEKREIPPLPTLTGVIARPTPIGPARKAGRSCFLGTVTEARSR